MSPELIATIGVGVPVILVGIGIIFRTGQMSATVKDSVTKIDALDKKFDGLSLDLNTRVSHLEGAAAAD